MHDKGDSLVWIDLEMTGLDPDQCTIMEIATLVTTSNLVIVAEGPNLVIHNSEHQLKSLSPWCQEHFGKSGFIDKVRQSKISLAEAEEATLEFLEPFVKPGCSPLCGNSVHNDRAFLYHHMRKLHDLLHYRNIDVSSVKELVERWYPGQVSPPPKLDSHRALADIRESVLELCYYRKRFFLPGDLQELD